MKKHLLIITLIAAVLLMGLVGAVSAARTPVAQFTASPTYGEAPLTVYFTDQSTGSPTSYTWKFGDGTTSNAKNPTHKYKTAGTYTVTETVNNRAGSNTIVKTGYITVGKPVSTPTPTTVATPRPTTIPTTVATSIPTIAATPVPTTTVSTTGSVTSAVEAAAYASTAYTQGNARLAQMLTAYHGWSVPSRPDLVSIATNARSSGLKGDGVTDDTAALQSLLTGLPSGSTIYFPPGQYRIDGPISINKPVTLFGESGTVFNCQRATDDVFTLNAGGSSTSKMSGVTITGLVIEGPGIETDPAMINAYYLQNFHVSNVKFHNIGYAAIRLNTCSAVTVEKSVFDNVFQSGLGYGVCITDRSDQIYIHDNFFVTKGRHGVATGTSNPSLPASSYIQSVTVENNYFEYTTEQAVDAHIQTAGPYVVRGNVMNNCARGVEIRAGTSEITDNVMINCKGGVVLTNEMVSATNLGTKVDKIVNNIMINILYEGIDVDRTNLLIQGNYVKGTGSGTAIYLEPFVPNTSNIIGNVVDSYTRGFTASTPSSTNVLVNNFIKSGGSYQSF